MDREKLKIGLAVGFFGAVLTLIGDILIGANPAAVETTGVMLVDMFIDAANNSDLRMVLGGILGALGIPLEGIAYFRIYQLIRNHKGIMPHVYKLSVLMYVGLAGAGTHLNCAAVPMIYKWVATSDPKLAVVVAEKYASYFLMPPTVIFGVLFIVALIYQMIMIWKEQTPYPRSAAFYNMMVGTIVAYVIASIVGNNAVGNGISTGAVSIGHLWMFGMMLLKMPDENKLYAA